MNTAKTLRARGLTILLALSVAVASLLAASSATAVGVPGKPSLSVVATCIKAVWTAVAGADSYKVQYSTSKSFTASTTTTVSTDKLEVFANNLVGATTYYFRVAAVDGATTSAWGTSTSAKAVLTHPAPTGVAVDNANGTSIELSWVGTPSTWAYKIRARSSGNPDVWTDASGTYATVTGLKKATKYSIRVYAARSEIDGWPTIILGPGSKTLTTTTSSYDLAAPQNLHVTKQKATSVDLAWDAVSGLKTGWKYQIQRALNTAMTRSMVWSTPVSTNSMTLSGLSQNTPYFVRLRVVDDKGTQRSDRTVYVMAKSVVARGTIRGEVNGAPSSDVVVGAYDSSNELAAQSPVGSDGSYSLKVRPGSYLVRANYVGSSGFASTWARDGASGAELASAATKLSVTTDHTTTAPTITVAKGADVSGVVKDPSGNPVADVDVSVLTASSSVRELVTSTVTTRTGTYLVKGLPDGKYWLRMLYSADGFKVRSIAITLKSGKVISVRVSTSSTPVTTTVDDPFLAVNARLDLSDWYRRYGVRIEGSKRVGRTQTAVAPPWVAGTYPASYGSRTLQWKRNGSPISGATKTKYTLRSADRGKRITVTATFRKYGYVTGSTTSKSYRIG